MREHTVMGDGFVKRISWSAVVAGTIVGLALSFLFHVLNAGLGLVSVNVDNETAVGVGAIIWLIITGIIAMFPAGWVAGKLSGFGSLNTFRGALHGFLAWGLGLILLAFIASNVIGSFFAGTSQILSSSSTTHEVTQASDEAAGRPVTGEEVSEKTREAATGAGSAALGIFFVLLIGAAAATLGGYVGSKHATMDDRND